VGAVEPAGGAGVLTPLQLARIRPTVRRAEIFASRRAPISTSEKPGIRPPSCQPFRLLGRGY